MKLKAAKRTVLNPVRASAAIKQWYQSQLLRLVDAMHASVMYWVKAAYRDAYPQHVGDSVVLLNAMGQSFAYSVTHNMAMDLSPAKKLDAAMAKHSKQWIKAFDQARKTIAKAFAQKTMKHGDLAFRQALKDAGFSIEFQFTRSMRDAMNLGIMDNINLIKSIPEQYLHEVRGLVARSAAHGRSLKDLTEKLGELVELTPKVGETADSLLARTQRRAALIARDQNNKLTALFHKTRQKELGITTAIWSHTSASKEPREEHEQWGADQEEYNIEEGMYSEVDEENVWPGTPINCGCTSRSIVPGYDDDDSGEDEEEL